MQKTPHQSALDKAKIQLMSHEDSAFFTTVCLSLKCIWDTTIPTACTNGKEIRFSPDFFMSLDSDERLFLLLHETLHVAYMHMLRLMGRVHEKWNIAADHVINLMLIDRGFKMPVGGLADPQYTGMSTEQVYDLLPDAPELPFTMDIIPADDNPAELSQSIQDILVRASVQASMSESGIGNIPGEIQVFLDRLLKPKLPWQRILQRECRAIAKTDYSFVKPNRRFFPKHHLPSMYGTKLVDLAIGLDISGSVSDEAFTRFVTEVSSILKMMKPDRITIVQFDTEIRHVDKVRNLCDLQNIVFTGRGGTRIEPILQWAKKNQPQLMLLFTDGGFRWYTTPEKPPGNLIWLIHENPGFTAPIGKVIHYEI